jgi:hypothetical protein
VVDRGVEDFGTVSEEKGPGCHWETPLAMAREAVKA